MSSWIRREQTGAVTTVILDRPELHNAFNADMIAELTAAFTDLSQDPHIRVVVLRANGKSFCAGADLNWMRAMLDYSLAENITDAEQLARMFEAIANCPKPVLGRIHGAAFGGGVGLVSVCDLAVALPNTTFCFSEAKLGLIPAVISPFVLRKIPISQASRYFLTAERFDAQTACTMGLISAVAEEPEQLDTVLTGWINALLENGPEALRAGKQLIRTIGEAPDHDTALQQATRAIAERRVSPEGQEGMRAFLEKRPPHWKVAPE